MDHAESRSFLYDFAKEKVAEAVAAATSDGREVKMRYQGISRPKPGKGKTWARVSRTVVNEGQESMRNGATRRFRSTGIVSVELYFPRSESRGQLHLDKTAETLRNAFRACQGEDVEFTGAVIDDGVADEPDWYRAIVRSNYDYRQFIS